MPHFPPTSQRMHFFPPQSTSVSSVFLSASLHVCTTTHTPFVQPPLTQSPPPLQVLPLPHRLQPFVPPQSTSDSSWFLIPSLHDGAYTHTLFVQSPVAQSAAT